MLLPQRATRNYGTERLQFALLLLTIFATIANLNAKCGVERWSVKVGREKPTAVTNMDSPKPLTIKEARAFQRPSSLSDSRLAGPESTAYEVRARLTSFKRESDSDYHLVLEDESGNTIIAEIPSPSCATGSPWRDDISAARQAMNEAFSVSTSFKDADAMVTITGVGFFDIEHGGTGQRGHAPNNFEIHPVLSLVFDEEPEPPSVDARISARNMPPIPGKTGDRASSAQQQDHLFWVVFWIMTILYAALLIGIVVTLRRTPNWSLAGALYESGDASSGAGGKPSSSRIIAFLGMLVLLVIYIGFGYVALWNVLHNQELPNINGFLLTGLSLFAPYAANQFKSLIGGSGSSPGTGGGGNTEGGGGGAGGGTAGGPNRAPDGVVVGSGGGGASVSSPRVVGITPQSVTAGAATPVVITGAGFDPRATISVSTPASGPIAPQAAIASNQISFSVNMPGQGTPYISVVRINNPDGGFTTASFQVT